MFVCLSIFFSSLPIFSVSFMRCSTKPVDKAICNRCQINYRCEKVILMLFDLFLVLWPSLYFFFCFFSRRSLVSCLFWGISIESQLMNEWISEYFNEKNSSTYDEKLSISNAINLGVSDYKYNGSIESEWINK